MQLKKINQDHYVVVTDEPIKEGDWYYHSVWKELFCLYKDTMHNKAFELEKAYKVTHSTQRLNTNEVGTDGFEFDQNSTYPPTNVNPIDLFYIKSLVGEELSVKEKVSEILNDLDYRYDLKGDADWLMNEIATRVYAIEDNKDKRFSEEDIRKAILMSKDIRYITYSDDDIISSITQPKDTWECEFIDGVLKLK